MNPKTVSQLKTELIQKRASLRNLQSLNQQNPNEDDSSMKDLLDRSDVEEAWFTKERMSKHWQVELIQIENSLARIEAGTFGLCEECDAEIPVKRLRVRPDATLCLYCQEAHEKENRVGRLASPQSIQIFH